jgi:hypothetical protein
MQLNIFVCKKCLDVDKPRGALPSLGWYYHWFVQISIGNKLWGPLNTKMGGTLRRLRIYHRQRNKFSASHITLVIIKYHSKEVLYIDIEFRHFSGCSTVMYFT